VDSKPTPKIQLIESTRTDISIEAIKKSIAEHLFLTQGRTIEIATKNDFYMSVAYAIRDRLLHRWFLAIQTMRRKEVRGVAYLSAEFLIGPQLENNLMSLGIYDQVKEAFEDAGYDLTALIEYEQEPGLGNGGLGRLAACFMDSLATMEVPAIGYGIRYEFGIFDQEISNGWQVEVTDKWLRLGNPWEIARPEIAYEVKLGGHTESYFDDSGNYRVRWLPAQVVKGFAFDTPVLGYKVNMCDTLRLWKAEAVESFDFQAFNVGNYYDAVHEKIFSETITKVLYPNDEPPRGKQLRLEQQYFLVSCSLQDMLRIYLLEQKKLDKFHEGFAIQLNDTHPSLAVAELMRLLIDEHDMGWDEAWHVTTNALAYTNHTLLPEALEKWSLAIFGNLLPRHLEIIFEINRRFLDQVRTKYPDDSGKLTRLSLIDETGPKYVRMAHLACVGSHSINGVAELHTELLKETVLRDFYEMSPEKFNNKTNGVTPRRFMALSNPGLTRLLTSRIGATWITNLNDLRQIEPYADDPDFRREWKRVKHENKCDLARIIERLTGIVANPESLFDIQVKRLHEYKRQHLNVLHIITLYNRIKKNPNSDITPRAFIFGGKAAPGYFMAKLIIKLINSVAEVVNSDPEVADRLKVVFFPDFNVKNGQRIYPAADLSEQISTAGKEASGTGNMKSAMNGALTIGTLDGANVEIREEVGAENFFLFGLTADQVSDLKAKGYNPSDYYTSNADLREAIDLISSGAFSGGDRELFKPLVDSILLHDEYMLLADYQSYVDCQDQVSRAFRDDERWTRMSILNVARIGKFSSDRSIKEYCEDIWKVQPVKIDLE
jgi:glycogen phosphorylase